MNVTRRVTANLPVELLQSACKVTGGGITETLVAGLTLVKRTAAAGKAARLRGRLHLDVDLGVSRERGLAVSTPDAHVAQYALDVDGLLLTEDRVFVRIAAETPLRLAGPE